MKTLLSLFDYSGNWSAPFVSAGWDVIQWDIKLLAFMDLNLVDSCETSFELFDSVDGILAAVPCTDFASSGAQYWKAKDADGRTDKSLDLLDQVLNLVNLYRPTDPDFIEEGGSFFWVIENPVGRIAKLRDLGDPFYFDPYEYAGHLNPSKRSLARLDKIRAKGGVGVTSEEAALIERLEAYTKKTCLYGEFNRDLVKKPIAPVKACAQGSPLMRKGGGGGKTKEERSFTPLGFAEAFAAANQDHKIEVYNEWY